MNDATYMAWRETIRRAMDDADVGPQQLADLTGIRLRIIQRWRAGETKTLPDTINLVKIAEALEEISGRYVSLDELAGRQTPAASTAGLGDHDDADRTERVRAAAAKRRHPPQEDHG
jgi:hypothetical protein